MIEASTPVQSILEYTDLAVARRFGNLPVEERERMDALEAQLRELIKGARPAPRNIGGHRAAGPGGGTNPAPQRASAPAASTLSATDRKKLNEVDASEIAESGYTASRVPPFLADYYSSDVVPASAAETGRPKVAVMADGSAPELRPEVRVFFGLEAAPGARPGRPAGAAVGLIRAARRETTTDLAAHEPTVRPVTADLAAPPTVRPARGNSASDPLPRSASGRPTARELTADLGAPSSSGRPEVSSDLAAQPGGRAPGRRSANIHLAGGGMRRGHVDAFDPSTAEVHLIEEGKGTAVISIEDVLAIAFGPAEGAPPTVAQGTRAVVKLVSGRQVAGLTPDYREGADALTLSPEGRRGSIDFIWIPASAVEEIHLG